MIDFQLTYARKAWVADKEAWRVVIQLNLVRSINTVADAVLSELDDHGLPEPDVSTDGDDGGSSIATAPEVAFALTEMHRELVERLKPLRAVQTDLEIRLGSGAEENFGPPSSPSRFLSASGLPLGQNGIDPTQAQGSSTNGYGLPEAKPQEFFVRSNGWKSALSRLKPRMSTSSRSERSEDHNALTIAEAKGSIKALWTDNVVQDLIKQRKVRLQDCAELCARYFIFASPSNYFSAFWVKLIVWQTSVTRLQMMMSFGLVFER